MNVSAPESSPGPPLPLPSTGWRAGEPSAGVVAAEDRSTSGRLHDYGGFAGAARDAPADGERAGRSYADQAARTARLHGPQLRPAHADHGDPGPPSLRRYPRRVLSSEVTPHGRSRSISAVPLLVDGGHHYLRPASLEDAISKQQRGLSPRSQRSWTGTPASSAIRVSAMRQTSGCSGVTPASGQL